MDETRLAQLRDFIIEARKEGETYDAIRQQLLSSGWSDTDVNDYLPAAWQQAEEASAPVVPAAVPPAMPPSMAPASAPAQPPGVAPVTPEQPAYAPPTVPEAKPAEPAYTPPTAISTPPAYPPSAQPGFGGVAQPPPLYTPAAAPPAYGIGAWFQRGWAMFSSDAGTIIGALLVTILLGAITVGICMPALMVGLNRLLLKKHDGQPIAVGDVFEGFRYFWSALGLALIMGILIAPLQIAGMGGHQHPEHVSTAMLALNGVSTIWTWLVSTFFLFAMPFIADDRGGAIDAISASFNAAKSDFGIYLAMVILTGIVAGLGALACFVGMFATVPWSQATLISVYRSRFPAR